ncbi:MAG: serine hydroxymethyltransferase, partial [Tabrizicola sp.]|nr:serine hydroxymethyltransferase [Tabrizicola sp.]
MPHLVPRPWVPAACETIIQRLATEAGKTSHQVATRLDALIAKDREIHDQHCFNLNPATNVMNPSA